MIIEIASMGLARGVLRQDGMRMMAAFTAVVGPVKIHHCVILKKDDGWLSVCTPFVKVARKSVHAIHVVDRDVWDELVRLALAEYERKLDEEPADAGLRRTLCAGGEETLAAAGI